MKDPIPKGKVNNGRWEVGKDDEKNTRISLLPNECFKGPHVAVASWWHMVNRVERLQFRPETPCPIITFFLEVCDCVIQADRI